MIVLHCKPSWNVLGLQELSIPCVCGIGTGGEQSLLASLSHRSCKLLVLLSASAASMSEAYCSALPAACLPHHGPKASRVQSTDGANRALFQHRARLLVTQ